MSLGSFLRRLRVRPSSGESVVLRPAEQIVLRFLLRFEVATSAVLRRELAASGFAVIPELDEVTAALQAQGLAEARIQLDDTGGSTFVLTAKGRKLKGRIPENPRTVTQFWL